MTDLDVPPDLYLRRGTDRSLRVLTRFTQLYERLLGSADRGSTIQPVRRDLRLEIAELRDEADDVLSLLLVAPDRAELPAWQPGCHVDVVLPSGRVRQYSLNGDPASRHAYRIAVRRLPDGSASQEIHDRLTVGTRLTVCGPRNAFPFIAARRYLFLAGGIGITPILPMVRQAALCGADWRLIYTGRSLASMPFRAELAGLDADRVDLRPDDEYGRPDPVELLAHARPGARVYCCGPAAMIDGVRTGMAVSPAASLHYERFAPTPVPAGQPFELHLRRSGHTVAVGADESALAAVRAVLPEVAYSCQQGFCGTCRVRLVSGQVEHNDHVLTERERAGAMMICVSRGVTGPVVVDL
jgi:ferredoxin-NADP reductase